MPKELPHLYPGRLEAARRIANDIRVYIRREKSNISEYFAIKEQNGALIKAVMTEREAWEETVKIAKKRGYEPDFYDWSWTDKKMVSGAKQIKKSKSSL
jgi:hypothetical protein